MSFEGEDDRHGHSRTRSPQRGQRHAPRIDRAEQDGRVARARQREDHPRAEIEVRIHARKRGGNHHKVHDPAGEWDSDFREYFYEWTAGELAAGLRDGRPWRYCDDDENREKIKND